MSGIDLVQLQAAFQKLKTIGHMTSTFEIPSEDLEITIRTLCPKEDVLVRLIAEEDEEDALKYLDRFRVEAISRCLMSVRKSGGSLFDFTGSTSMSEDGDKELFTDTTGKSTQKCLMLRPVVQCWGRDITEIIFRKYNEMAYEAERRINDGVKFEYQNMDDEIKDLEARLARLKALKEQKAKKVRGQEVVKDLLHGALKPEVAANLAEHMQAVHSEDMALSQTTPQRPTLDAVRASRVQPAETASVSAPVVRGGVVEEDGVEIEVFSDGPVDLGNVGIPNTLVSQQPTFAPPRDRGR